MKKDDLSELESLNSVMDLSGILVAMMNQENILQEISDHLKKVEYLLAQNTKINLATWKAAGSPGLKQEAGATDQKPTK